MPSYAHRLSQDPDLVAYWPCTDGKVTVHTVEELTGTHDGTVTSTVTKNDVAMINGETGGCFTLSKASNEIITISDNAAWDMDETTNCTISFHVKIDGSDSFSRLLSRKKTVADNNFNINVVGTGPYKIGMRFSDGASSTHQFLSDDDVVPDGVVTRIDISKTGTSIAVYVDGEAVAMSSDTPAASIGITSLVIGGSGTGNSIDGSIGHVEWRNRALTAEEIRAWYRASSGGPWASSAYHVALVGDPQIGFGTLGYVDDEKKVYDIVNRVNRYGYGMTLFMGDLIQDHSADNPTVHEIAIMKRVFESAKGRALIYGNHDYSSAAQFATLPDWFSGWRNWTRDLRVGANRFRLIGWDSVVPHYKGRDGTFTDADYLSQMDWLRDALSEASIDGADPILLTHYPPFIDDDGDAMADATTHIYASDTNTPLASSLTGSVAGVGSNVNTRATILSWCNTYGCDLILCGHVHWNSHITTDPGGSYPGIDIWTICGPAKTNSSAHARETDPFLGWGQLTLDNDGTKYVTLYAGNSLHWEPVGLPETVAVGGSQQSFRGRMMRPRSLGLIG